jgi:hypothetical protein
VAKLGGKSDSEEVVKYSKEGKVLVTPTGTGSSTARREKYLLHLQVQGQVQQRGKST